ncbi:MAG: hypothetical protein R3C40_10070 [Parvularculaceae bacterium]
MAVNIGSPGGQSPLTGCDVRALVDQGTKDRNLSTIEIDQGGNADGGVRQWLPARALPDPHADVANFRGLNAVGRAFTVFCGYGDVYFWDAGDGPAGVTLAS